jgi:predicted phage gp36 major capsid-like protein
VANDPEVIRDVATLKAHVADMRERLKETEEECRERESKIVREMREGLGRIDARMETFEKWKVDADIGKAVWAAKLSGASAVFAGIAMYWDQLKSFFGWSKP